MAKILKFPDLPHDGGRKHRVQIDMSEAVYDKVVSMSRDLGGVSFVETIRFGLRLLSWFLDKRKQGYDLALHRDGEFQVLHVANPQET